MPSQQLYAVNTTTSVEDNLLSPVKDPLWFLAMQWRTGEFEAEDGGTPAGIEVNSVEHPLTEVERDGQRTALDLGAPLEQQIEHEDDDGGSAAWRSAALAYDAEVATARHRLRAVDYPGDRLDWYHFDLTETRSPDGAHDGSGTEVTRELLPTSLRVRGAPDPRWWRFENDADEPIAAVEPEPNVLSTLLPEFVFIDGNNWFVVPLPQHAGTIREITQVRVTDSFGVQTDLGPAITSWRRDEWGVFVLAGEDDALGDADGRYLFVPNVAIDLLHNDDVEEVRFIRDEEANLVWAYERLYLDDDGNPVHNGDQPTDRAPDTSDDAEAGLRYVLADAVPPWWVPYVPRTRRPDDPTDGAIYLRRARTVEDVGDGPQHRSRIVGESWQLDEHEVPRTGVRVRRIRRYARGSDGQGYHWIGRIKQTGQRTAHPDRRYDELEGR